MRPLRRRDRFEHLFLKTRLDMDDGERARVVEDFFVRCAAVVVLKPELVVTGQPSDDETAAKDGAVLHILDLPDEDYLALLNETADFALGGARRERFPESEEAPRQRGEGAPLAGEDVPRPPDGPA
jgi:hypothetical protein